jgi:hypothetical protein
LSALPPVLGHFERLSKCFPPAEAEQLRRLLEVLPELDERSAEDVSECFRQAARSLPPVAEAIQACPSVLGEQRLGGRERTADSLVEALCHGGGMHVEFVMPTAAILGRSFVLAKINFLKALGYVLDAAGPRAKSSASGVRDLVREAVFSKLAEELLIGAVSNPHNALELKQAAAHKLVGMWNDRLAMPIGEFPPVLLSAWRARGKVRAIYGTMIGVNEVFSLIQAECESRFVNYFARDSVTGDERDAFREFIFGLSYEELEQLRAYMETHRMSVITPEKVREVLTGSHPSGIFGQPSPEEIYSSYCRRRIRAEYRAIAGNPGPRKTAEGYIMESLLREGLR